MCNCCNRMVEEDFQIEIPFELINRMRLISNTVFDLEDNASVSKEELAQVCNVYLSCMEDFIEEVFKLTSQQFMIKELSYEIEDNENSSS